MELNDVPGRVVVYHLGILIFWIGLFEFDEWLVKRDEVLAELYMQHGVSEQWLLGAHDISLDGLPTV